MILTNKILIVANQAAEQQFIQAHLTKIHSKHQLRTATTISEIREALKQENIDLVISDYQIDGFSGRDVLEIVRNYSPDLPFILVNGELNESEALQMFEAGANYYVKRNELEKLHLVVKSELEHYQKLLQVKQERDEALHDLTERVKEQKCIYGISNIDTQDLSIEEFLSRAVDYLPPGWQYRR